MKETERTIVYIENEKFFETKELNDFLNNEEQTKSQKNQIRSLNSFSGNIPLNKIESKSPIRHSVPNLNFNIDKLDISIDNSKISFIRTIPVHKSSQSESDIGTLNEIQNFQIDNQAIWIAKISRDKKYIAFGGKSGAIRVYFMNEFQINQDNELQNLETEYSSKNSKSIITDQSKLSNFKKTLIHNLINPYGEKVFRGHKSDVVDICWGSENYNYLLSSSLDKTCMLWNVDTMKLIHSFDHSNMVVSLDFNPNNENIFASGCLDKILRIWDITKRKVIDYLRVNDLITKIAYSPDGNKLLIGFENGNVDVYNCENKISFRTTIECKNRFGFFSDGRKITGIEFINLNEVLITTNDSRIRIYNLKEKKFTQKFKGLQNEEIFLQGKFDEINELTICPSDDKMVYIWKLDKNTLKNGNYDKYKPFEREEKPICSLILNQMDFLNYQKRLLELNDIFVNYVFINCSDNGRIQVLISTVNL